MVIEAYRGWSLLLFLHEQARETFVQPRLQQETRGSTLGTSTYSLLKGFRSRLSKNDVIV